MGRDIGWLALGLAVVLALASLQRSAVSRFDAITQGALYVCMVMAVYLDHVEPDSRRCSMVAKAVLFPLLIAAVVLRLRLTRERRFEITPLDLLVIFVALALPNLPGLRRRAEQPRAERGEAGRAVLRGRDAVEPFAGGRASCCGGRGGLPGPARRAGTGAGAWVRPRCRCCVSVSYKRKRFVGRYFFVLALIGGLVSPDFQYEMVATGKASHGSGVVGACDEASRHAGIRSAKGVFG